MGDLDALLNAIELLYAAGLDPRGWVTALGASAGLLGGVAATIEVLDRRTFTHSFFSGYGVPDPGEIAYLNEYAMLSPRIPAALKQKPGELAWDYQILDEPGIDRSPFYANFLAPMGMRYAVAGVVQTVTTEFSAFAIQRSARQGHVDQRELDLMQRLLPHVGQALDLGRRLEGATRARQTLEETLAWLADAAVLIGVDGRVLHANRAAVATIARADVVRVRSNAIEFLSAAATQRYRAALASLGRPLQEGGSLALDFVAPRGDLPPYVVSIRPLRGTRDGAAALMFIHDPLSEDSGEFLRAAFGLTTAEAHVAEALRRGIAPDEYARRQGVSINTVYTHVRRIKVKCRKARMVDLVHLLNTVRTGAARPDRL